MSALLRNWGAWGRNWRGWICREKRVESLFRRLQQHGWRDTVFVLGRPRLEFLRLKGKPYKIYESKSASGRGWLRILLGVFLVLVIVGVAAAGVFTSGLITWRGRCRRTRTSRIYKLPSPRLLSRNRTI